MFRFLTRTWLAILWARTKLPFVESLTPATQAGLLKEGRDQLVQGRIEEAARIFESCLKKAPLNEEAALWLTRTRLIQGDYLEAQRILFRALAWHSQSSRLHHQLAGLLLATGSFWDAETEYRKLVETSPTGSTQALLALADLSVGDARYEDAFAFYKRVLKHDSFNIPALLGTVECAGFVESASDLVAEIKSKHAGNRLLDIAFQTEPVSQKEFQASNDIPVKNHRPANAVLIIDYYLPATDRSAGSSRLFEIIKLIRNAGYHVTLIARNGEYQKRTKLQLEDMGIETYATDPERLIAWSYRSKAEPIQFSQLFKKNHYVLGIVSRHELAGVYLPLLRKHAPGLPVAIDTVDVHFRREEKKGVLYGRDRLFAQTSKKEELLVYGKADSLITVSEAEAEILRKHFPSKRILVIPLIYRAHLQRFPFGDRKDLLFVGNFVHPPNSDAFIDYCARILPLLKRKLSNVKTYVVGANSLPLLEDFASEDIIITGYVPSLKPFLNTCRVNVAPLRYGAGTNGKILESLAAGLPVITSPVGAEGIADERGLIIAEEPEEFVDGIVRLYNNEELWNSMRDNGQALIENRFTPRVVREKIAELLSLPDEKRPQS